MHRGDIVTLTLDRRPVRVRVAEFIRGEGTRRTFHLPDVAGSTVALWCRSGWAPVRVVGERAHQPALRAIVGNDHRTEGAVHHRSAVLVPEPDNPFDPTAVAVQIDHQRIGYLDRDTAARYHEPLRKIHTCGHAPVVDARIWAADYNDWDDEHHTTSVRFGAGVLLAMDEPHLLLPVNTAPINPHALLPHGGSITVHDTAAHLERLYVLLAERGAAWAYATLHHVREQLARSTRDIVEIHINGRRIGKLTPRMSTELLPVVRYLDRHHFAAAARLLVAGNRAAVTTTLHVVRAHQLDDQWFDDVAIAADRSCEE